MPTKSITNSTLIKLSESIETLINEIRESKTDNKHQATDSKTRNESSDIAITVRNGGGRSVSYNAPEFYQLMYDQGKTNRSDIEDVKENVVGINETVSIINQDIMSIKKTLDSNIKTVTQNISEINTSLPEHFDKKIEKFNARGEAFLKIIKIIAYLAAILYFIGNLLIKNGVGSNIQI